MKLVFYINISKLFSVKSTKIFARNFVTLYLDQIMGPLYNYNAIKSKVVKDYEHALNDRGHVLDKYPFFSLSEEKKSALVHGFNSVLTDVPTMFSDYKKFSCVMAGLASKPNSMMRMTIVMMSVINYSGGWGQSNVKAAFEQFFNELTFRKGDAADTSHFFVNYESNRTRSQQILDLFSFFPVEHPDDIPFHEYGAVSDRIVKESVDYATKGILPTQNVGQNDLSRKTDLEINKYVKGVKELDDKFRR